MYFLKSKTSVKQAAAAILHALIYFAFTVNGAFANSADWAKPVVDLGAKAEIGLGQILMGILGIGIMVIGGISAVSGNFEPKKLAASVFGGALVILGPAMIRGLLSLAGGS